MQRAVVSLVSVCLVSVCLSVRQVSAEPERCEAVNDKCMSRVGCGMALHNFLLGCDSVIYGDTDECTVQCTRALISLLSTEDQVGQAFTDCDCGNDTSCLTRKGRVEVCTKSVLDAIKTLNDTTVVSCSLARWLCEADSSCLTALKFYVGHCEQLMNGIKCSSRCNNSLAILYRQTKAAKMINCACEGTEDFDCVGLRTNTERFCFNKDVPYDVKDNSSSGAPMFEPWLSLWVSIALYLLLDPVTSQLHSI